MEFLKEKVSKKVFMEDYLDDDVDYRDHINGEYVEFLKEKVSKRFSWMMTRMMMVSVHCDHINCDERGKT